MTDPVPRRAWMTYAWADNQGDHADDVDFYAQEIEKHGIRVGIDRYDLVRGQRLWPQIEQHITDPALSDGWIFVASSASLASEPCREELNYALGRALSKRGAGYPIVGLVIGGPTPSGMPAALTTRLWVSTLSPDFAREVASGIRGEAPGLARREIPPFVATVTQFDTETMLCVYPRAGRWLPFVFGIPLTSSATFKTVTYAEDWNLGSIFSELHPWQADGHAWRGAHTPAIDGIKRAFITLELRGQPVTIRFGQQGGPLFDVTVAP